MDWIVILFNPNGLFLFFIIKNIGVKEPTEGDSYRGIIYTGIKKNLIGNIISFLDDEDIVLENTLITVDGIIDRIKDINRNNICIYV